MTKTYILLPAFIALFLPQTPYSQWSLKPTGTTISIQAISHGSSNAVFATEVDDLLRSFDGGQTWQKLPFTDVSGAQVLFCYFPATHFFNENEGVVVGNLGFASEFIMRTTNGGDTWSEVHGYNFGAQPPRLNDTDFPASNIGYAVGNNGRVLKTNDAGNTWNATGGLFLFGELFSVDFVNEQVGCVVSYNNIHRTVNGGLTWSTVHNAPDLKSVSFSPDGAVGYACGGNTLLRSTDQGSTWTPLPSPFDVAWLVEAPSADAVYLSVLSQGLFVSTSDGQYWESFPTVAVNHYPNGMSFFDPQQGCVVGQDGSLYCTGNAGGPSAPVPVFSTDETLFCQDSIVHFTNRSDPAYNFTWHYNGTAIGNSTDLDFALPEGGVNASISLQADNGSFVTSASQSFTVEPSLDIPPLNMSLALPIVCPGETNSITINNVEYGVSYQLWQDGAPTGPPVVGLFNPISLTTAPLFGSPNLWVRASKSSNCGTRTEDSPIAVPIHASPSLGLAVSSPDNILCEAEPTTIQVQGSQMGVSYQLLLNGVPTGNTTPGNGSTLVLPTGPLLDTVTITVRTVQTSTGCVSTLTDEVFMPVEKRPTPIFTISSYNQTVGDPIFTQNASLNPGGSQQWTFSGPASVATSTDFSPSLSWSAPGDYTVSLSCTSPNGCQNTSMRTVRVLEPVALDDCMGSFIKGAEGELYALHVDSDGNRIAFLRSHDAVGPTAYSPAGDEVRLAPSASSSETNYYLFKFDKRGISQWGTPIKFGSAFEKCGALATDSLGNVYAALYQGGDQFWDSLQFFSTNGSYFKTSAGNAYVVKYDKDGVLQWVAPYSENYTVWQMNLVVDTEGNTYLGTEEWLRKFSPEGDMLWSEFMTTPNVPNGYNLVGDLELCPDGNLMVGMHHLDIRKIAPDGTMISLITPSQTPPIGQPHYRELASMELATDGSIFLAGQFYEDLPFGDTSLYDQGFLSGAADGFVAKVDPQGNPDWIVQIRSTASHKITGFDLSPAGNAVWFGVAYPEAVIAVDGLPSIQFVGTGHYAVEISPDGLPLQLKKLHEDQSYNGCNVTLPFEDLQHSPDNGLPVMGFEYKTAFSFDGQQVPNSTSPMCEFFIANASLDCFNAPDLVGVWPGDCNDDGTANHTDLLSIGLCMGGGLSGPARFDNDIDWSQKAAAAWASEVVGVNAVHADPNGDGIVSAADTLAIVSNFGQVHGFAPNESEEERSGKIKISIGEPEQPIVPGQIATFPIVLSMPDSLPFPLYGIAFEVSTDSWDFVFDNFRVNLEDSWLNTGGNAMTIAKQVPQQPKRLVAQVRSDGLNMVGEGKIGEITGEVYFGNSGAVNFYLVANLAVDASGSFLPFQGEDAIFPTDETATGQLLSQPHVRVSPSPATDFILLEMEREQPADWRISNQLGQILLKGRTQQRQRIDVAELPSGQYFVSVQFENGLIVWRNVVIQ